MIKHIISKNIFLIFMLICPLLSNGQITNNTLSINLGYGGTEPGLGILGGKDDFKGFYSVKALYHYKIGKSVMVLKPGLGYNRRNIAEGQFQFLEVPFYFDFEFGKKYKFILGTGLEVAYMLRYKLLYNVQNFDEDHTKIQLGTLIRLGCGYQFSQKWGFNVFYQNSMGLKGVFYEHHAAHVPGGGERTTNFAFYDIYFTLCVKYTLCKQE